ncbi:MAG: gfo/Idh/MocA family oxidoreductase [Thaumarchaeota archaeon]|nr:MAG: gfo/Idh/MocA family oxidoreductase [Nitrososphaerota archaeon]
MIRIGMVGFDTSHVVEFTKRINHFDVDEKFWVEGARIVAGYPGKPTPAASQEIINERTKILKGYGVEIVDKPEDLIGRVDAVMIEYNEGAKHLEASRPFMEAGLPVFIDKPLACSIQDAKKIIELAKDNGVPVFSSSSLRYALEIQNLKKSDVGRILSASTYGPGIIVQFNPGLFFYVIHAIEMLYALMGKGCKRVRCYSSEGWDVIVGEWEDGRIGIVRGLRIGVREYGFTAFYEKKIASHVIDTSWIYTELLKRVIDMFKTKKPPVEPSETLEITAFTEKAMESSKLNREVEVRI